MTNSRLLTTLTLPLTLALGACSDAPVGPDPASAGSVSLQQARGTGLVLDILTDAKLPLDLGGTITIDQAVITDLAIERIAGQIVGVQVTGTLTGTVVNALGETVAVTAAPFVADVAVTSSGPGQCSLVKLSLTNIDLGALGVVQATVPAEADVKGSGAVGSLLCNLGSVLGGLLGRGVGPVG
ncbi:MAG TPA: hypothetical protein VNA89_02605 [Gemmatimonadaceae bacterium]|nr:hypothetical protein [Gemmatimonadaceae bacterium]